MLVISIGSFSGWGWENVTWAILVRAVSFTSFTDRWREVREISGGGPRLYLFETFPSSGPYQLRDGYF